ncbi:MAG: hypothetical protein ACJAT7_003288 [Psychromonas sp.]|jgi:hypothetical protein|uniref:hypothetical protein n=1 Tax=Psychromonas sp. TaxID=1884585 RepID=UPI0039E38ABE
MIENPDPANPHDKAEQSEPLDELQMWTGWLQQSAAIGTDILQLLQLELRLAITDSKRLLVVALLFIPLLMLTWIGFTALLAWLVYLLNTSITQGLLTFFISQALGLMGICMSWKYYKKSFSLPLTREHIQNIIGGQNSDT